MADPILYETDPMKEWFGLDNLDSDLTLLDSIPSVDCGLMFPDMNGVNTDSTSSFCPEPWFSEFISDDHPDSMLQDSLGPIPDADYLLSDISGKNQDSTNPSFDFNSNDLWNDVIGDGQSDEFSFVRQAVEAQAAADMRCSSKKEKRMDASIALHLRRLQDASAVNLERDNTSLSSPCSSDLVQDGISPGSTGPSRITTPTSATDSSSTPNSGKDSGPGGVEIVLDLNMNATTNLPKKHKPRSRAQRENYIKVRKHGACEKHKKQHKRCNCLDKKASQIGSELAAGTTPPQVSKQPSMPILTPQPQQSTLSSREILKATPNPQPTIPSLPRNFASRQQLSNPTPWSPASNQPVSVLYARQPFSSTSQSGVPGAYTQVRPQARPQPDAATHWHAVSAASQHQHTSRPQLATRLQFVSNQPSCPGSWATQTRNGVQSTREAHSVSTHISPTVGSVAKTVDNNPIRYFKRGQSIPSHDPGSQPIRQSAPRDPRMEPMHDPGRQPIQNSLPTIVRGPQNHRDSGWTTKDCSFMARAGKEIGRSLATAYSFFQASSVLTSKTGLLFGRAAIACVRAYWSGKKSQGLGWFSACV